MIRKSYKQNSKIFALNKNDNIYIQVVITKTGRKSNLQRNH